MRARERVELEKGEQYAAVHQQDIGNIVTAMFGTPDEPHFPQLGEDLSAIIDLEKVKMAAGAVASDREGAQQGLYREHCAACHGISGDGAGPTAIFLNPYPRDFRLGKFKFKQTEVYSPPTDEDLTRILVNGIPGTGMPSFRVLPEEELAALTEYVKYLSIRGQVEGRLIDALAELNLEDGERLIDLDYSARPSSEPSSGTETSAAPGQPTAGSLAVAAEGHATKRSRQSTDSEILEQPPADPPPMSDERAELLDILINDLVYEVLEPWIDPSERLVTIPEPPPTFELQHTDHAKLVDRGRELFFGQANCVQCHGNTGLGDGGQVNFDDWTSLWIKETGVNLQQPETYQDFLELGALPPRQLRPRNLRMGVYRGGNRPMDLYHRLSEGIEGTPMPATLTLSDEEKWALVAYVMNLPYEPQQ